VGGEVRERERERDRDKYTNRNMSLFPTNI